MWIIIGSLIFVAFWGFLMLSGKWFLNRPQWQRILSMGLITTMMFTMVWYMNEEAAKNELTWVVGEKAVEWSNTPVRVIADPNIRQDIVQGAIDILNRGSCELFVLIEPAEEWDVVVIKGPYGEISPGMKRPMAGSSWRIPLDSAQDKFLIKLNDPSNITKQMLILAHELTHIIGLDDDSDPRFITTNGAQTHDSLSTFLPRLSETDTKALKKRYCH